MQKNEIIPAANTPGMALRMIPHCTLRRSCSPKRYDPFMTRRTLCALPWVGVGLTAADWPNWRGPSFDGVSPEKSLPLKWSRTQNVRWRVPLAERGNSTPILWGDRIYLTQAVEKQN